MKAKGCSTTYWESTAGVQHDWHRHFALKVDLGEVEDLFPKHLLLLHPPHAIETESNSVVVDHLRLHVAEVEGLCEDGARASLDSRLGSLFLGG